MKDPVSYLSWPAGPAVESIQGGGPGSSRLWAFRHFSVFQCLQSHLKVSDGFLNEMD